MAQYNSPNLFASFKFHNHNHSAICSQYNFLIMFRKWIASLIYQCLYSLFLSHSESNWLRSAFLRQLPRWTWHVLSFATLQWSTKLQGRFWWTELLSVYYWYVSFESLQKCWFNFADKNLNNNATSLHIVFICAAFNFEATASLKLTVDAVGSWCRCFRFQLVHTLVRHSTVIFGVTPETSPTAPIAVVMVSMIVPTIPTRAAVLARQVRFVSFRICIALNFICKKKSYFVQCKDSIYSGFFV